MSKAAICVVVPVYKAMATLDRCVESVLAQQVEGGLTCILVDDGSPDACPEICERYARDHPGLVRVLHQENQGLSAARNTGIDAARGRYYAFVDSDDVVCPGYLHTLYAACEKNDAYMALCSVEDVQENGKSCDPASYTRPNAEGVFCGKDLLNEFYTPNGTVYTVAWNKLYRAEVWKLLHYPEGRLTRMTLWPTACSGGATRSSAWTRCCTTTGCAAAASAAPTPSPKPLTLWTAWLTATASMWKTVLTAR